jgi:hypothetical protein
MALKQGQADRTGTTASAALPSSDRATRFIARLDDHLRTLADDASRRAFLDRQLEGWEHRYARFIATEGDSEPVADPANPPQAADFLLTITALAARRDALGSPRTQGTAHA